MTKQNVIEQRIAMVKSDISRLYELLAGEAERGRERLDQIVRYASVWRELTHADSNLAYIAAEVSRIASVIRSKQEELEILQMAEKAP